MVLQAGMVMLSRNKQLIPARDSFAIETTLTTITYLEAIKLAHSQGYQVTLFYVWLNSSGMAIERVNDRVMKGGHNIPVDVIERRYYRSLKNLPEFMSLVNDWYLYDNSGSYYELVAKRVDFIQTILNFNVYNTILHYGE